MLHWEMEQLFREQVQNTPLAEAIVEGPTSLSYSDLLSAAESLKGELLSANSVKPHEPIGILLPSGIRQVVSQLAVCLAGATCVPLDINHPIKRIKTLLQDIEVKRILVDRKVANDYPELSSIIVEEREVQQQKETDHESTNGSSLPISRSSPPTTNECHRKKRTLSHILFTSGSSGKPKPVQINEEGIIHLALHSPITPLLRGDRVSCFISPGFDVSLFEMWVTLFSGATIVVIPKKVVMDPGVLPSFLFKNRVSVFTAPAALIDIIGSTFPGAFHGMRHVITTGEPANIHTMQLILKTKPPRQLWNLYGPTEGTIWSTIMELTPAELERGRISIGYPIGKTRIYLVDDHLQVISKSGIRGEICIAGPGKSPGYLNAGSEESKKFVSIRIMPGSGDDGRGEVAQVYRTGDIGEWRADLPGCLDFMGRQDTQIKHKNYRVELEEIASILQSDARIRSAAVVKSSRSSALVAFVIPNNSANETEPISPEAVICLAKENLPQYMIPAKVQIVSKFSLTANGKIDRQALLELDALETTEVYPQSHETSDKGSTLSELWKNILGISVVEEQDDFFHLGATSLQAGNLIAKLSRDMQRLITMDELHSHSRFSDLLQFLGEKAPAEVTVPDESKKWKDDICLVDNLVKVPNWQSENEGKVFLTGASGFIGVHLLHCLLHRPAVKQVVCLARAKAAHSATDRILQGIDKYELRPLSSEIAKKLIVVEGDLGEYNMGLEDDKFNWLADWASVIFHLGAKNNYCESYHEHYRENILGTMYAVKLATTGRRKPFHYTSGIDVWGVTGFIDGTQQVMEDASLMPYLQAVRYDIGYAQSKWTMEGMVRRMQEQGLPAVIYRPGFVIGDSKTGASNPNDFISRLVVGCIQMGSFPRLLAQRHEYVTIDTVIEAIMHIASSDDNLGHSYNLVPSDQSKSITTEETCDLINNTGYPVRLIDYRQWLAEVSRTQLPDGPLAPLVPGLQERVLGGLTRWEASQYTPRYDSTNTVRALKDRPDIEFMPFTPRLLRQQIDFWNRKGFFKVPVPEQVPHGMKDHGEAKQKSWQYDMIEK